VFPIRKLTGVITHPARTAGAVTGATLGVSVGAATAGMRATARVVGWALERAGDPAPSKKAAVMAPALGLPEAVVEGVVEDGPRTPSGIPAAGEGVNPDTVETDLHQPGTEPLMDPATVKAVASESEVMRRAADRDKG
jgi:hypothetical protein